jgi:hypothetical protein
MSSIACPGVHLGLDISHLDMDNVHNLARVWVEQLPFLGHRSILTPNLVTEYRDDMKVANGRGQFFAVGCPCFLS